MEQQPADTVEPPTLESLDARVRRLERLVEGLIMSVNATDESGTRYGIHPEVESLWRSGARTEAIEVYRRIHGLSRHDAFEALSEHLG